jgi:hypothetical protein
MRLLLITFCSLSLWLDNDYTSFTPRWRLDGWPVSLILLFLFLLGWLAALLARHAWLLGSSRLRRAVEIWLSDAGIGGNAKSSSLRGFDTGPLLEFADRENLLGTDAEEAAAEQQHFISRNS